MFLLQEMNCKLIAGLFILVIISTLACKPFTGDNPAFEKLLRKNVYLLEKAKNYNQNDVLGVLAKNKYNGFYFRFDEEIHKAKSHTEPSLEKQTEFLLNLNFDWDQILPSQDTGETIATIKNGLLSFKTTATNTLIFKANIKKKDIGKIEVRAKHKKGKYLYLGWSTKEKGTEENAVEIVTVPDGKFHVYSVEAKNVLRFTPPFGDEIRRIFLNPSHDTGDEVAIDYIRFISKKQEYNKNLYGRAVETKNNEARNVIFSHAPVTLEYSVSIPNEKTVLSFGLGILDNSPVIFEVRINGIEEFRKTVSGVTAWEDVTINMDKFAGMEVEIEFSTSGKTDNIAFWSNPIIYGNPAEKFNVILLLEDALREDHMSCYGYYRNTTPVKDELIKEGILFQNAFSQATKTRPSCPSIMTSLYPTTTGVWNFYEMLSHEYLTLAEILRAQGFLTTAFIQNANSGPAAGLHQGYSHLFDDFAKSSEYMYSERIVKWLEKNKDRNFFLYVHIMDPHGPYDPPEVFRNWYMKTTGNSRTLPKDNSLFDPDWVDKPTVEGRRALYDGEIKNNDHHFKKFLKKLRDLNIFENTLIVFISDHGEHLGEHNEWEHHPPGYIQVIKTPIVFVCPGKLPKDISISEPIQNLDVMPTILELANVDNDKLLLQGDSLLSLMRREKLEFWKSRVIISEEVVDKEKDDTSPWASIIMGGEHILSSKGLGIKLFNYIDDPEEVRPQELDDAKARYYTGFIKEFQYSNMKIWKDISKEKDKKILLDPKTIQELKALGYM